jgi:signal transduction histidine kinase
MNSPLQVITGAAQSLLERSQEEGFEPEQWRNKLELIHRSGWRCAEIIRALCAYAHTGPLEFQPCDLNALVRDTLLLVEHQLRRGANITVLTDLAPHLPPLQGDRNQLAQVLLNLLTNACDAMPEGGEIRIRTEYDASTHHLILSVSDTGVGIPQEIRSRIFEPFFTTKPPGRGIGLGLALVAEIVHAHGGEVKVHSVPGQGTTFVLSFPVADPDTLASPAKSPSPREGMVPQNRQGKTVAFG